MADVDTDVLIVGAGPTALVLSIGLRRYNVRCRVIDQNSEEEKRAIVAKGPSIQSRTVEIFDELGVAQHALDRGLLISEQHMFVNGVCTAKIPAILPDGAFNTLALPQYETEDILLEQLNAHGVEIEYGKELISFEQADDHVELTVRHKLKGKEDEEIEKIKTKYVVGCDGVNSGVRRLLNLEYEGSQLQQLFILADVEANIDCKCAFNTNYRILETVDPDSTRIKKSLVCIPYKTKGKNRFLITMMAPAGFTEPTRGEDKRFSGLTVQHIQDGVDGFAGIALNLKIEKLFWSSFFNVSYRLSEKYQVGRVFLAGDAAHTHSPTSGQGLNTGVQDAFNLAWKLALVVKKRAHADLLTTYEEERRPVAEQTIARVKQRTHNLVTEDITRIQADSMMYIHYRGSSLSKTNGNDDSVLLKPGDRAPDVTDLRRDNMNFPLRLFELLRGKTFKLLIYLGDQIDQIEYERVAGLVVDIHSKYSDLLLAYGIQHSTEHLRQIKYFPIVSDPSDNFKRVFGAQPFSVYLIRPDRHIGFYSKTLCTDAIEKYLASFLIPLD